MAPVSKRKESAVYIEEKINELQTIKLNQKATLNKWYIRENLKFITYFISWYHHANLFKLSPEINIGHEIHGLFRITKSNKK